MPRLRNEVEPGVEPADAALAASSLTWLRRMAMFTRDDHPSLYGVRLLFAGVVAIYCATSGPLSGALPLGLPTVLAALAFYAAAVLSLWIGVRSSEALRQQAPRLHVLLDAGILTICVAQDPSPSSPLMMLVLAALIDHGLRFRPQLLGLSAVLGIGILAVNFTSRTLNSPAGMPPPAIWLSFVTSVLMLYFTMFLWAVWVGRHAPSPEHELNQALAEAARVSAARLREVQRTSAHRTASNSP
ncbi:MAG TPA: hypothetical protein VHE37_01865 [Nevskiaceae bacterium]|nr:hypothetical protein [Nevskiaceae bacterium]